MEEKLLFVMELLLRHGNKLNTTTEEDEKLETYISELEYEISSKAEIESKTKSKKKEEK